MGKLLGGLLKFGVELVNLGVKVAELYSPKYAYDGNLYYLDLLDQKTVHINAPKFYGDYFMVKYEHISSELPSRGKRYDKSYALDYNKMSKIIPNFEETTKYNEELVSQITARSYRGLYVLYTHKKPDRITIIGNSLEKNPDSLLKYWIVFNVWIMGSFVLEASSPMNTNC